MASLSLALVFSNCLISQWYIGIFTPARNFKALQTIIKGLLTQQVLLYVCKPVKLKANIKDCDRSQLYPTTLVSYYCY